MHETDLVVGAVGDIPNTEWLASTGPVSNEVVPVDDRGPVRPEIAAAGDPAAFPTASGVRRIPLWNSVIEQAKVAATVLLRGPATPSPDFRTEQFGLTLQVAGHLQVTGPPGYVDGAPGGPVLLRRAGTDVAAAPNYRIPAPRLRGVGLGVA